jgi:small-conductance mechanosensitive channel/CRP-like cAMP-binding protein
VELAWQGIWNELLDDRTIFVAIGFFVVLFLVQSFAHVERGRVRATLVLFVLHFVTLLAAGAIRYQPGSDWYAEVRLPALIFESLGVVGLINILIFGVMLPRVGVRVPRILISATASIIVMIAIANKLGFPVSGLITTSAVLTAVIGFSLQDTLGNIMGGLALQMDNSIKVGDWVKVGDLRGRISEIRWRYTAVETRNWETVNIPNGVLMKGQVVVEGRRTAQPLQLRRWVYFNVDFRYQPSDVIEVVQNAIASTPIERVAADPKPNCVCMDVAESYCRYAVRYWLTDLAVDDPTDSVIRTRIFFALKRANISLSPPAHAVFLTDQTARKMTRASEDIERRKRAIAAVDLFVSLSEEDRTHLAEGLQYAPFTGGEVMTRQGAEGHWLYMMIDGTASVRVATGGAEREVAQLKPGNFFGEMSLMTGAPRLATVVAITDVECYRLDKAKFQDIISARPELAEEVAGILAQRRIGLSQVQDKLDHEAHARKLATEKANILGTIRGFFNLRDK